MWDANSQVHSLYQVLSRKLRVAALLKTSSVHTAVKHFPVMLLSRANHQQSIPNAGGVHKQIKVLSLMTAPSLFSCLCSGSTHSPHITSISSVASNKVFLLQTLQLVCSGTGFPYQRPRLLLPEAEWKIPTQETIQTCTSSGLDINAQLLAFTKYNMWLHRITTLPATDIKSKCMYFTKEKLKLVPYSQE